MALPELDARSLKGDLYGGITAAVVALPLALAFGVSSGAGAIAGLYGAIFVGLFAALFGGTPSQVSGPTGPMTVVMAAVYTQYVALDPVTGPAIAFTVVMLSGLFQILFGALRLGQYITQVPFPVISGFMTGIGIIIICIELGPVFGHDSAKSVATALSQLPNQIQNLHLPALLIAAGTLLLNILWPKSWGRIIPAPLMALLLGTLAALSLPPALAVDTIGEIPSGLPEWHLPVFSPELIGEMLISAVMLAALGSIDSLLTSLVADNMTRTQHKSDKELIGQGLGNLIAGFFGGLPGAGATMRTVVNIRAGGSTPVSGAVHALVLLIAVLGAGSAAEHIPLAVLAGILLKVGWDIIDWSFLKRIHTAPPFVSFLMLLVLGLTLFVDLITAVGVGVFIANVYTVKRLSEIQLENLKIYQGHESEQELSDEERRLLAGSGGKTLLYVLRGPISFAAAKGVSQKLMAYQNYEHLILDMSEVPFIGSSTAMVIEELLAQSQAAGCRVSVVGLQNPVAYTLQKLKVLHQIPEVERFETRKNAMDNLRQPTN
ncbi:SulP family inorganic anion transporter [Oceanospirillum sanctuarii]|uniref:SulP family inorganic anion transporter n=1 Tax=Oceanospirillum sanctuarii TaxID=1434821 RepID=UPI000A39B61C|nr:SulP family inorganic anion transporter [Oceanospirillum sanctuarii]